MVEWVDTGEKLLSVRIISVREAEAYEINQDDLMNEETKPEMKREIDPDNPPLTGKEVWQSGREHILKKIADHQAKHTATKGKIRMSVPSK